MRTYIISNIRKHAASIFPIEVKADVFATNFDRSQVPEIVTLLRNPNRPELYPRHPTVLYRDSAVMAGNLFGGMAIINVSTLTLFPCGLSESPNRYSKRYSSGQRHSPPPLGSVVLAQNPLLVVRGSSH